MHTAPPKTSLAYWLIDVPAKIVDWTFFVYRVYMLIVLTGAAILTIPVIAMLVLYLFGIRWGW